MGWRSHVCDPHGPSAFIQLSQSSTSFSALSLIPVIMRDALGKYTSNYKMYKVFAAMSHERYPKNWRQVGKKENNS